MNTKTEKRKVLSPMILKRQEQLRKSADSLLISLTKEFIDFKNRNITGEKNGILSFAPEVTEFGNKLVEKWLNYCTAMNKDRNRVLNYNYTALPEAIDNHMKAHMKLAWVNECMKLLAKKSINEPDMDKLTAIWDGKLSCRQGVNRYLKTSALSA